MITAFRRSRSPRTPRRPAGVGRLAGGDVGHRGDDRVVPAPARRPPRAGRVRAPERRSRRPAGRRTNAAARRRPRGSSPSISRSASSRARPRRNARGPRRRETGRRTARGGGRARSPSRLSMLGPITCAVEKRGSSTVNVVGVAHHLERQVVPGDQPAVERRDPRDRLALAQPASSGWGSRSSCVDRDGRAQREAVVWGTVGVACHSGDRSRPAAAGSRDRSGGGRTPAGHGRGGTARSPSRSSAATRSRS